MNEIETEIGEIDECEFLGFCSDKCGGRGSKGLRLVGTESET